MLDSILGNAVKRVIVPVTVKEMESSPLPAAHSPGVTPDAVSVLAAVIASRNVQNPSLPFVTSDVVLTVIALSTFAAADDEAGSTELGAAVGAVVVATFREALEV